MSPETVTESVLSCASVMHIPVRQVELSTYQVDHPTPLYQVRVILDHGDGVPVMPAAQAWPLVERVFPNARDLPGAQMEVKLGDALATALLALGFKLVPVKEGAVLCGWEAPDETSLFSRLARLVESSGLRKVGIAKHSALEGFIITAYAGRVPVIVAPPVDVVGDGRAVMIPSIALDAAERAYRLLLREGFTYVPHPPYCGTWKDGRAQGATQAA